MDAFDEVIGSAVRRAVDKLEPATDLWLRVERGLARKRPATGSGLALAAAVAALLAVTVALPQPRALALDLARRVFKLGAVQYVVEQGGATISKVPDHAAVKDTTPPAVVAGQGDAGLHFYGAAGHFPEEASKALAALKAPFRVPTWLPSDLPVRVDIMAAPNGVMQTVFYWLGDKILVAQMSPAPNELHVVGPDKVTAKAVTLGKVPAMETRTDGGVSYRFNLDGVELEVSGPADQTESVRRIAESLTH